MTALRVMPPSSAAIWLAERPSDQSFFRSSTRSSVHDMLNPPQRGGAKALMESPVWPGSARRPTRTLTNALEDCPSHEMSYETIKRLQYGGSRAQESAGARPHIRVPMWMKRLKTPPAAAGILS